MAFVRNPVVYVPDLTNGRPIVDGKVYVLTTGTVPPMHDSAIDPLDLVTVSYYNEANNLVEQPQPLYTSKGGCLYGNYPDAARQFIISPQAYVFAVYNRIGQLEYSAETTASDYVETDALAAANSTVLVGGVQAQFLANELTPEMFGAVGDGVANDTTALNNFFASTLSKNKRMTAGKTYKITGCAIPSNNHIDARGATVNYVAAGVVKNETGLLVSKASNVHILGGNYSLTGSSSQNPIMIRFYGCTDCSITGHSLEGNSIGHRGIVCDSATGNRLDNKNISVMHARYVRNFTSFGTEFVRATDCKYQGNTSHNNLDGFKSRMESQGCSVLGNVHYSNSRDGFDFFSGMVNSSIVGNVSHNNTLQGFEFKGQAVVTFVIGESATAQLSNGETVNLSPSGATAIIEDNGGGALLVRNITGTPAVSDTITGVTSGAIATLQSAPSANDYCFRGNTITGNQAYNNGVRGCTFQGVRDCQGSGNMFWDNDDDGVLLNDVQMCDLGGSITGSQYHGLSLQSVSRCTFSFHTRDNNTSNTVGKNGINCDANADGNTFIGVQSYNGTVASRVGFQNYGINFDSGSAGNTVMGGRLFGNTLGDIGGDSAANNILAFTSANAPYASAESSTATTAELASLTSSINTKNKYLGKQCWNSTTGKPVYSKGTAASSVWVDATGATAHTPV